MSQSMGHFIKKCSVCGKVIVQCRCMDCIKIPEFGVCLDCIGKAAPEENTKTIINLFKDMDYSERCSLLNILVDLHADMIIEQTAAIKKIKNAP